MDPKIEQYKWESIRLCEKLIRDINKSNEDAGMVFGGEILKAFGASNDKALNKAGRILYKIKNL